MVRVAWLGLVLTGCGIFEAVQGGGPTSILANNVQPQVFSGGVLVDGLQSTNQLDALPDYESGSLETLAQVFARPPVDQLMGTDVIAAPDEEVGFLERWVFRDDEANAQLTESGFLMRSTGISDALCTTIEAAVAAEQWESPRFAEQTIEYIEPDAPDDALEGADMAATFIVYQPNAEGDIIERGFMFRVLPTNPNSSTFQDHWLLKSDYAPLGKDGSEFAIVVREGPAVASQLTDWFEANAPASSSYAVEAYPIGPFPDDCFDVM